MRHFLIFITLCSLFSACTKNNEKLAEMIIPQPYSVAVRSGDFTAKDPKVWFFGVNEEEQRNLMEVIKGVYPKAEITHDGKERGIIKIEKKSFANITDGSYSLDISEDGIIISAHRPSGLLYAIETIAQLNYLNDGKGIPCMYIEDMPRFQYRGMHLDVSRHFFDVDFIKKQLDVMAFYKMNRLHWHLTDGAGWRIEIKKHPKLTEEAAWRPYKNWKEFWFGGRRYCKQGDEGAVGGYYTQDQIREVVAYAKKLNITVIPEIEMPGHSEEVLAVYPNLACSGQPYKNSEFCAGNEETFKFLEDVLTEVAELFPSEYIHIGGDEADKGSWKKCPKCQKRIRDEKLSDENALQSYFIKRIEAFLSSKGKKLIGWDEIMDGGVSPYATVMSWRNEESGIKAAQMGHNAIMTPGKYCYFDAYQDNPITEPEAIGGYLPLSKVYGYNPVPDSLSVEVGSRIIGVQSNLWTEYIPTKEHVEYMIYPRLLAISEVAWSMPENKSWDRFILAANRHIAILKAKGINAHPIANGVTIEENVDTLKKELSISIKCARIPSEIRYTTDGSEPDKGSTLYEKPILVKDSITLRVAAFNNGEQIAKSQTFKKYYHKAIGKKITYNLPYSKHYEATKDSSLTDGYSGGASYGDGRWQGFSNDIDVVVDMGSVTQIRAIIVNFMQQPGPWIWFPEYVDISVSDDGKCYKNIRHINNNISRDAEGVLIKDFGFNGSIFARYIRYVAHQKQIEGAYMFIDEITVK
ncbi:MAG: family 20 glycosylhydrolase [Bacteroidales bacterium]